MAFMASEKALWQKTSDQGAYMELSEVTVHRGQAAGSKESSFHYLRVICVSFVKCSGCSFRPLEGSQ